MKKIIFMLVVGVMFITGAEAMACVGKILYIGVSDSPHDQLLAEMVSVLVMERTGTTAKVITYKSSAEIYNAVKQGQVGLVIESTDQALQLINRPKEANAKASFELVKKEYRKTLNLVWLAPFGSLPGNDQYYAPVIAVDVLGNLPALPKLINKLAGILNDGNFSKLIKSVKASEKPKKVARDFLKAKKYI